MASYRNPYSQQGDVNMIGRSLNAIFNENSPEATRANAYVARANRYQQLADAAALEAEEQRLKNQKAMFEANRNRRLAQSTVPQIQRMFNIQEGDPTAQDLASFLIDSKGLVNALFGSEMIAANERGMDARDMQNYGRAMTMAAGRTPKLNDAFSERGADMVATRQAEKEAAAYAGKLGPKMEFENYRQGNRRELLDTRLQNSNQQLNRRLENSNQQLNRRLENSNEQQNRRLQNSNQQLDKRLGADKEARDDKRSYNERKFTAMDNENIDNFLNVVQPLDNENVPQPVEFTGNEDVDARMHNFIEQQFRFKYDEARKQGKSPNVAKRIALNGLAEANVSKTKKYSTGFLGDSTEIPKYILADLRAQMKNDIQKGKTLAQQLLDRFGIKGELQQIVIDDLIATSK